MFPILLGLSITFIFFSKKKNKNYIDIRNNNYINIKKFRASINNNYV